MNEFNENPVFAGLSRLNTIAQFGKNPSGWYVRERINKETGKGISLELGAYLNETVFISVPVHYTMKNLFKLVAKDDEFTYYQVPMETQFAVVKYTSKRTQLENAMLVAPSENNPPVFIAACAFASKTAIVNCTFENPRTKVLRKYFDKDRSFIGFIAFNELDDNGVSQPEIKCTIKEAILNTTVWHESKVTFSYRGHSTEEDSGKSDTPVTTEFIKMPMFIELPPKPKAEGENQRPPRQNNNKDGYKKDYKPRTTPTDGTANNNYKPRTSQPAGNKDSEPRKYNNENSFKTRNNDRYNRRKGQKNNKSRKYDD